jgi:hypothetical protein
MFLSLWFFHFPPLPLLLPKIDISTSFFPIVVKAILALLALCVVDLQARHFPYLLLVVMMHHFFLRGITNIMVVPYLKLQNIQNPPILS